MNDTKWVIKIIDTSVFPYCQKCNNWHPLDAECIVILTVNWSINNE